MPQKPKMATDSAAVRRRHGKAGHYRINAQVTAETKDKIVAKANEEGITVSALFNDMIDFYFDAIK